MEVQAQSSVAEKSSTRGLPILAPGTFFSAPASNQPIEYQTSESSIVHYIFKHHKGNIKIVLLCSN